MNHKGACESVHMHIHVYVHVNQIHVCVHGSAHHDSQLLRWHAGIKQLCCPATHHSKHVPPWLSHSTIVPYTCHYNCNLSEVNPLPAVR